LIVDAQSVKNTDTAIHKGYDAGKKISGFKRHIAADNPSAAVRMDELLRNAAALLGANPKIAR